MKSNENSPYEKRKVLFHYCVGSSMAQMLKAKTSEKIHLPSNLDFTMRGLNYLIFSSV